MHTKYRALWIALLILSIVMTFYRIGADSLWYDESYSIAAAGHPVTELVPMIAEDSHPPLYYLMLRATTLVAGNSRSAARALSALGAIALAALGFFGLRKLWGDKGGLIFSILILVTPITVAVSHEARMYSWVAFFVTGTVIWGQIALSSGKKRDWAILSLLTLGAAYTHYYGLLAVALYWLVLLGKTFFGRAEQGGNERLRAALIVAGITVAAYLPWLVFLVRQAARVTSNFWIPPVTAGMVVQVLLYPFSPRWNGPNFAPLIFLAVLGFGAYSAIGRVRRKEDDSFLASSALAVYALTFVCAIVLSVAVKPIFYDRYLVSVAGVLVLAFASFVRTIEKRRVLAIALALYAVASAPVLFLVYRLEVNGPLDQVVADIGDEVKPGDVFVHGSEHTLGLLRYAFPNNEHYLYIPEGFVPYGNHAVFKPGVEIGHDLTRYNDKPVTIWYCTRANEFYNTPRAAITDAAYRRVEGAPRSFTKQPGWLTMYVTKVLYDPAKAESGFKGTGNLTAVVSGLDPSRNGKLCYALYESDPIDPSNFIDSGAIDVTAETMRVTLKNISYKDYAIFVFHDENGNFAPDFKDNKPTEGIAYWKAPQGPFIDFDALRFPFTPKETERSFKMTY